MAPPPAPNPADEFFGGTLSPPPWDPRTAAPAASGRRKRGLSGGAVLLIFLGVLAVGAAVLLVPKFMTNTGPEEGVAVGESGYVLDKPEGWARSSFNDMAANFGYLSEGDVPGTDLEGIRAFSKGDAAIAVAVIAVPPEMQGQIQAGMAQGGAIPGLGNIGTSYQHDLGYAIDLDASQTGHSAQMTMILASEVMVVGVVVDEHGTLSESDVADYRDVIKSLRRANGA